jgi:FAD binding domain of DNA photolyase
MHCPLLLIRQNWVVCAGLSTGRPFERMVNAHEFKQYDPKGEYVRLWVHELQNLPPEFINQPWKMNEEQQAEYGLRYGIDYPYRMVLPRIKAERHRNEDDVQLLEEMKRRGMLKKKKKKKRVEPEVRVIRQVSSPATSVPASDESESDDDDAASDNDNAA